jgi:hypothetical protein
MVLTRPPHEPVSRHKRRWLENVVRERAPDDANLKHGRGKPWSRQPRRHRRRRMSTCAAITRQTISWSKTAGSTSLPLEEREVDPGSDDDARQPPRILGTERLQPLPRSLPRRALRQTSSRESGEPRSVSSLERPSSIHFGEPDTDDIAIGTCDPRDVVGGAVGGWPERPEPSLIVYSPLSG